MSASTTASSSADGPLLRGRRYRDGIFDVGAAHGFLPACPPSPTLPAPFEDVQRLIDELPVWLDVEAGVKGVLGHPGAIKDRVLALPNLASHVDELDPTKDGDAKIIHLVFRAYTFLASAYLLEPAHHGAVANASPESSEGEHRPSYGRARRVLPSTLAQPLALAAAKLSQAPWLEYHYAYSLGNFVHVDPTLEGEALWDWTNLKMAVSFSGVPDETGFIMLHVSMASHTPALVGSISDALCAAERIRADMAAAPPGGAGAGAGGNGIDWVPLRAALAGNLATLTRINAARREMWRASRPDHYNDFRVFIMGITGNHDLFGDGVVYEGVEEFGGRPQQFRGQTGAQDDIIPTEDIFCGLTEFYPTNHLTSYLMDLRAYRPLCVQRFLADLKEDVGSVGLSSLVRCDRHCAALVAGIVDQIFQFRNGHWQFVQRYIMQQTRHAVATGGTPITTWLPNQLEACLDYLDVLAPSWAGNDSDGDEDDDDEPLPDEVAALVRGLEMLQPERRRILEGQMRELTSSAYTEETVKRVFALNEGHMDASGAPPPVSVDGSASAINESPAAPPPSPTAMATTPVH